MKRVYFIAVLLCAALLFSGCGVSGEQPSATAQPTPTPVSIESRVAAYADADVMEEDGQLVIGIRVDEADTDTACVQFFNQAEDIYAHCISGESYTGVSFSLMQDARTIGSVFILPDEGGMKVYAPVVFNTDYEASFLTAFYASDFAKSLAD